MLLSAKKLLLDLLHNLVVAAILYNLHLSKSAPLQLSNG
jgi:hypothetical protein